MCKRILALVLPAALAGGSFARAAEPGADLAAKVNLDRVRLIALQNDGRFKTFDTMAREIIKEITGRAFFERQTPAGVVKQDPVFTYLDMMFNPQGYRETGVIYVKKKPIRESLVRAAGDGIDEATRTRILKTGLVSISFLQMPSVRTKLIDLRSDVMKGAKDVDMLITAASLTQPNELMGLMRVIPPPGGTDRQDRWFAVSTLASHAPNDAAHAGMHNHETVPGMPPETQTRLEKLWSDARSAWAKGDAAAATAALDGLAAELPKLAPAIYPPHNKLSLEHWYYKYSKMTWTWVAYMAAVVMLLMGIVYSWPRARAWGVGLFGFAFVLHTIASGIRWYLAGRIPNSNMFEAVTAAAWFGAAMAMFFEAGPWMDRRLWVWRTARVLLIGGFVTFVAGLLVRGVPFHNFQQWGPVPTIGLIALSVGTMAIVSMVATRRLPSNGLPMLGAAVTGMVAMMCGNFMTISLDSDISNRMPVLNDVWLYIHTNMIIASYALIGIAYVTSAMYVVGRLLTRPTAALWWSMLIPSILIPAVGLIPGIGVLMVLPAWIPFLLVFVAYVAAAAVRLVWRRAGDRAFSVWEGGAFPLGASMVSGPRYAPAAGMVLEESNPLLVDPAARKGGLASVLDGATMLLFELFFIILWTGIIMGAVWADHSWGRPWGWDPKEVFALNTWIIFLILVHVRIKVQDKALWTAVLGVVGCSVMLFNWIVVNFFITGLHSYA